MSLAIGIDLGTTHSCVAIYRHGFPEIIKNNQRGRTTPSVVYFGETSDDIQIGRDAKRQLEYKHGQTNTIYDAKRIIGKKFKDPEVSNGMKKWPFRVVSVNGKPNYEVSQDCETKRITPLDISSHVLGRMRETASNFLCANSEIEDVVITVPAYFNHMQRASTIQAAGMAGFKKIHLLNEPVASAIAYGIQRKYTGPLNVLVFDLGGGTCDVSIVHIDGLKFQVLASAGNTNIGGQDFDERIVDHFITQISDNFGVQLDKQQDRAALYNLRCAAESLKNDLSSMSTAKCSFAYPLPRRTSEYEPLTLTLTRSKFDELCADLFEECMKPIKIAFGDANLTCRNLKFAILVGGCSRIIRLQKMISELLDDVSILKDIDPDEAIAQGAAIEAFRLQSTNELSDMVVSEVTSRSLGIAEGVWLCKTMVFVPRKTRIPCSKTVTLSTNQDYQTAMVIKVVEGDYVNALMNDKVGKFSVEGIPPARKGEQRILVRFDVGANGVLDVTATVSQTGLTRSLTVKFSDGTQDCSRKQTESNLSEKDEKARLNAAQSYWDHYCEVLHCIQEQASTFTGRERLVTYVKRAMEWIDGANWRTYEAIREMNVKVTRKLEDIVKSSSTKASDSPIASQILSKIRKRTHFLGVPSINNPKRQKLQGSTTRETRKKSTPHEDSDDSISISDKENTEAVDENANKRKKCDDRNATVQIINIEDDDDDDEPDADEPDAAAISKSLNNGRESEDEAASKSVTSECEERTKGEKFEVHQSSDSEEENDDVEVADNRNLDEEEVNCDGEEDSIQIDEHPAIEEEAVESERSHDEEDNGVQIDEEPAIEEEVERSRDDEGDGSVCSNRDEEEISDASQGRTNGSKSASDEASENGSIWISEAE